MAQERTIKDCEYTPRKLPKDKICRYCRADLTADNITQSRIDRYDYICNDCLVERLAIFQGKYRYTSQKKHYRIERGVHTSAPRLKEVDCKAFSTNYDLLKSAIQDTEQYRLDKMFSVALSRQAEGKDKKAAVNYLLKSFDKLKKKQCVALVNVIHKMIADTKINNDIKIKLAAELRAFTGDGKSSKDQNVSSYESMLLGKEDIAIDE